MRIFAGVLIALLWAIAVAQQEQPERLTATDLQESYSANSLAANVKYQYQEVIVVGKIVHIYDFRHEGDSRGYLAMQGRNQRLNLQSSVNCLFERISSLLPLKVGGMAQVRGVVLGREFNGSFAIIWLNDCSLVIPYNGPRW